MKLIIGLGNPGKEYKDTRHNVGFMALDILRSKLDAPKFKKEKKFDAEISEIKSGKEKFILAKPLTFMNNSGEAVSKLLSFYKVKTENLIVIHDDLDLELASIRKSINRGSAGHNGAQSIIDILKTKNFARIRIGIGRPPSFARPSHKATEQQGKATDDKKKIPPERYVLQKFRKEELKKIETSLNQITELL